MKTTQAPFDVGERVRLADGSVGKVVGREHVDRDPRRGKSGWRFIIKIHERSGFNSIALHHQSELRPIEAAAVPIGDDDLYGVLR